MAIAEARAAWQRTANRFLVQEDAKRAPKLACCPSASSSVKEVDAQPTNAAETQDVPSVGFLPYNRNSSYSDLSPNSRWWLQLQPNRGFNSGLVKEQLNSEVSEMDTFQSGVTTASKGSNCEDGGAYFYESVDTESFDDSHFRIPSGCVNNDDGVGKQQLKHMYKQNTQDCFKLKDGRNLYELEQMGGAGCAVPKKTNELFYDSESPWIVGERTEPWWRTSDRDELALLVAQRSFGHIENCDLPQPQRTCIKKEYFADLCCFDHDGIFVSSTDQKHPGIDHDFSIDNQGTLASFDHHLPSVSFEPLRDGSTPKATSQMITGEKDRGKAQLLEALRHSQTRAREAEMAAKQAYEEKEHVVKLVFRQASQLFAYKQWFQLLQLENLYFQIKNQNEPISSLFPVTLPWVPLKTRKVRKNWQKAAWGKRAKRACCRYDICKYAVVFALGLSLVGAGLLLGWTVGWMLPTF